MCCRGGGGVPFKHQEVCEDAFEWISHIFQTCFLWRWFGNDTSHHDQLPQSLFTPTYLYALHPTSTFHAPNFTPVPTQSRSLPPLLAHDPLRPLSTHTNIKDSIFLQSYSWPLHPKGEDTFLWNIGKYSPNKTVSHSRRHNSPASPVSEPRMSHCSVSEPRMSHCSMWFCTPHWPWS
jgi:hypothetical protein